MSTTQQGRSGITPAEVFVISDLHIGGKYGAKAGERGFRINSHVSQLAAFIHEIRQRAQHTKRRTELVINGDFLDFLAEEAPATHKWRAFIAEQEEAVAVLDEIASRDEDLFAALHSLIAAGVQLTILLGNHDVELSLPAVRARLRELLGAGASAPFTFIYDGEAYVVGDVLIEHGNRYDGWNVVDHDRLRRQRSESSRRLPLSDDARFEPPAGSQLVEQVMNPIKKDYAFVDLLKPETEAAIPLLLALEPDYFWEIEKIELARLRWHAAQHEPAAPARPAQPGDISGGAASQSASVLEELLARQLGATGRAHLTALVQQAERAAQASAGNIAGGGGNRLLSFARLLFSNDLEKRLPPLLDALRGLQTDQSFNRAVETGRNYSAAAQELTARGFATVVFGHTHLAKEVEFEPGIKYLNTGTWADLLRVPAAIIQGEAAPALAHLRQFAEAIRANRFDDYLEFLPTFAHIELDQSGQTSTATIRDFTPGSIKEL